MIPESAGPVAGKRALTVCAYLAADSGKVTGDLRANIRRDLFEMQAGMVGVGPEMDCVAMFDDGAGTYVTDCKWKDETGPAPSANMGNPETLMKFLDWAIASYPAENYALIVGSHGSGPKADPIYRTVAESAQVGAERAIAFDDSSRSFLSIPDLRRALEHGVEKAGKPFAVLLMDACYMASFEVLHEMQGLADYVVASPEAVPGVGMPYTILLRAWSHSAQGNLSDMHNYAVEAFEMAYKDTPETASLVAVDMAKVHILALSMNILGNVLMLGERAAPLVADTMAKVPRASDPDFVYLYPLCYDLAHAPRLPNAIIDSAQDVCRAISDAASASWENGMVEWGPTVFLPRGPVPAWYKALAVAGTAWGEWVMKR